MSAEFAVPREENCPSLASFEALACNFAKSLRPGDVVALSGQLGAGKTTFVRAAVAALHGEDQTTSPTFTFWHRYHGEPPIDHIDLYRLDDPREARELGLEEAFDGTSIAFVEWWTHAPQLLPATRYEVEIEGAGDGPRQVRLTRRNDRA